MCWPVVWFRGSASSRATQDAVDEEHCRDAEQRPRMMRCRDSLAERLMERNELPAVEMVMKHRVFRVRVMLRATLRRSEFEAPGGLLSSKFHACTCWRFTLSHLSGNWMVFDGQSTLCTATRTVSLSHPREGTKSWRRQCGLILFRAFKYFDYQP